MVPYTIDDPITEPLTCCVEVTIDFEGQKRWLFFATPELFVSVGDLVEDIQVRCHLGEQYMVVVSQLDEAHHRQDAQKPARLRGTASPLAPSRPMRIPLCLPGGRPLRGISMTKLRWIESGGGPLIVIPVEIAHHRRGDGGLGLPNGDLSSVWDTVRDQTDYGRACGVSNSLGVLQVGPGECLVLGDEPMSTAFLPTGDGCLLIRWIHAENEKDVVRAARSVPKSHWEHFPHPFRVGRSGLLLFDSANPGDDLPPPLSEGIWSWSRLPVSTGTYLVSTGDYQPDDPTHVILHRLRQTGLDDGLRGADA